MLGQDIVWHWVPNSHQYEELPQRIGNAVVPSDDTSISTMHIDLDGDGIVDFDFRARSIDSFIVEIVPRGTNEVLSIGLGAAPLERDGVVSDQIPEDTGWLQRIDGPLHAIGSALLGCVNPGECIPSPFGNQRHYVGVRFWAADGLHYGVLDVAGLPDWAAGILYGYGYSRRAGASLDISQVPGAVHIDSVRIARPGYMRLQWNSLIGKGYELQIKEEWRWYWIESGILINATSTNTVVDIPLTGTARYFRLMRMD